MEKCSRCQRNIENLETTARWNNYIICEQCRQILASAMGQKTPEGSKYFWTAFLVIIVFIIGGFIFQICSINGDTATMVLFGWVLAIGIIVLIAFFVIRAAVRGGVEQSKSTPSIVPRSETPESIPDVPGKFKIRGVDRATKLDTVWVVQADTSANAKVKAELEGIIVTSVERLKN